MSELSRRVNAAPTDAAYEYASVPPCVIDAVFSIGVRYESTERTVTEFCERHHWQRDGRGRTKEHTVSEFVKILEPYENRWEEMADHVFRNRQRTSTRSGILKAEATFKFAKALQQFGIETFADLLESGLKTNCGKLSRRFRGSRAACPTPIF